MYRYWIYNVKYSEFAKTLIFNGFRKTMKNWRKSEHYSMKFCYTNIETLTSFGLLVTKYALCKRGEKGNRRRHTLRHETFPEFIWRKFLHFKRNTHHHIIKDFLRWIFIFRSNIFLSCGPTIYSLFSTDDWLYW